MYSVDIGLIAGSGQCWVNVRDGGSALARRWISCVMFAGYTCFSGPKGVKRWPRIGPTMSSRELKLIMKSAQLTLPCLGIDSIPSAALGGPCPGFGSRSGASWVYSQNSNV